MFRLLPFLLCCSIKAEASSVFPVNHTYNSSAVISSTNSTKHFTSNFEALTQPFMVVTDFLILLIGVISADLFSALVYPKKPRLFVFSGLSPPIYIWSFIK